MLLKPPPDQARPAAPLWMVTFADLMALILTCFVLLLSFSTIELKKFEALSVSVRSAFGLEAELDPKGTHAGATSDRPSSAEGLESPAHTMMVTLRQALEQSPMKDLGSVDVTQRGVTLRLPGDGVFASGSTELTREALDLLDRLAQAAASAGGEIEVEGHTDDVPIRNAQYPSNWELSTARAGSAVRHLASCGLPHTRLKAIGYADTRPLVPNTSPENRAKNRRVEFLFVHEGTGGAKG